MKYEKQTDLLMPMATATWLIDNTALDFEQIAAFTGMHLIEIQAIADGEMGYGIVGRNPIEHKELTKEEIERCEKNITATLKMTKSALPTVKNRAKGPKYTPVSKRGDKPDAIYFIIKKHPEITDAQICKLIGTTKPTIDKIRNKEHANMVEIVAKHPADLGMCTYEEFQRVLEKALKAQGKTLADVQQEPEIEEKQTTQSSAGGFDFSNFLGKRIEQ
jgi:hypothetical protein